MKRTDLVFIFLLVTVALIIFFGVFTADYLYTDEAVELWYFKTGINYKTSVPQGRYISYKLFTWIFNSIHTIKDVKNARLFSLFGWLLCLPVWYYIINRLVVKNGLPKMLAVCALVYLVCMPSVAISVGWSACMELFIANTAGLLSGYLLYAGIQFQDKMVHVSATSILLSLLFGLIALFTYQNGFGCFYIPFLIHFIAVKKISKTTRIGVGVSLFILVSYYLLFKYSIRINALEISNRSGFAINPLNKLVFFLARPLSAAFHFTWIINESNKNAVWMYGIFATAWLVLYFKSERELLLAEKITFLSGGFVFLLFIYLPSLIVAENYASSRTTLALNMAVLLLVADTLFSLLKKEKSAFIFTGIVCMVFIINGWYNFNKLFIEPVSSEFRSIQNFINNNYRPGINSIDIIRPTENIFNSRDGIVQSWDEFGLPSASKDWVPEPLIKQLIFEKTGDSLAAENTIVKSRASSGEYQHSNNAVTDSTMVIDIGKMILTP